MRRCAAPAPQVRSQPRASARSHPCRPRPRWTRYSHDDPPPFILDCDPGHDDAIALLLALASPEIDLVGVTTVHGNQTVEKTTDNALRVLAALVGREDVPVAVGADRPLVRDLHVAAHVDGESGLDGPDLLLRASEPVEESAVDFLVEHVGPETVLVGGGATDERRSRARPRQPAGADRPHGRRHRRGQHDAGGRVQHLGRSGGRGAGLRARAST